MRPGRYQRAAAPHAGGRNHLATHVPRPAAPQLSPLFLGTARLTHWHMDATDRDELVRLSDHELEVAPRYRRRRVRADDAVLDLGRIAGRSLSETLDHRRDANRTNDLRFFAGSGRLVRVRDTIVHYYYRWAQWRSDGLRHARAPGVYRRNGKPRRFAECHLAQQLDCERRAHRRPVGCWSDDRRGRCGDVFLAERHDLYRRNRRFVDDASASV